MKKLFFIASVGLLFSCNNSGTCTCTYTNTNGGYTATSTSSIYYENDAQENCDVNHLNAQTLSQQPGVYGYCELE
jgi:hypothetical protein